MSVVTISEKHCNHLLWPKIVATKARGVARCRRDAQTTVALRSNSASVRGGSSSRGVQCSPFSSPPPFPPFSLCLCTAPACPTGETGRSGQCRAGMACHLALSGHFFYSFLCSFNYAVTSQKCAFRVRHESKEISGTLSVLLKSPDAVCS